MKLKDYNSSDSALRREHLDKWHTFSQVSNVSRGTQGLRASQVRTVTTVGNVFTGAELAEINNTTGAAGDRLTILDAASSTAVTNIAAVYPGDIVSLTSDGVTFDLDVISVSPAHGTTSGAAAETVITFAQRVRDVSASWTTNITGLAVANVTTIKQASLQEVNSTVRQCVKTLDNLTIKAHGIPIYNNFPSQFYNAYVPYHYGGPNVRAPQDCGALMVNFCLYPGTYQPSGHINVSRAREFYLEYISSVVTTSVQGQLVVNAVAINFLLISDGSAVLRYST